LSLLCILCLFAANTSRNQRQSASNKSQFLTSFPNGVPHFSLLLGFTKADHRPPLTTYDIRHTQYEPNPRLIALSALVAS